MSLDATPQPLVAGRTLYVVRAVVMPESGGTIYERPLRQVFEDIADVYGGALPKNDALPAHGRCSACKGKGQHTCSVTECVETHGCSSCGSTGHVGLDKVMSPPEGAEVVYLLRCTGFAHYVAHETVAQAEAARDAMAEWSEEYFERVWALKAVAA